MREIISLEIENCKEDCARSRRNLAHHLTGNSSLTLTLPSFHLDFLAPVFASFL